MKGVLFETSANLNPFKPFIDPSLFGLYASLLCLLGAIFGVWFIFYEITTKNKYKVLFKEVTLMILSSILLGVGLLFVLLWGGLWV